MQLKSSISGDLSARSGLKAQGNFEGCQEKSQNDCAESSQKMVVVGKFGKTFGVEGFIKVHSFTEIPENILKFFPWYVYQPRIRLQSSETTIDPSSLGFQLGAREVSKRSLLAVNEHCERARNKAGKQNAKGISVDEKSWVALAHDDKTQGQNSYNAVIKGKNILIKPPAINSPEEAQIYTNQLIGITREQMPPLEDGDFYWTDLEKLRVITKDGKELGIIDHIFNSGASDILVVRTVQAKETIKEKQHACLYIPYLKHVILDVDLKNKTIIVDWDETY